MKLISAFRAMGAAFALVLLGVSAHAVFILDPPNGPSLGTQNVNPYTLATAIGTNTQQNFQPAIVIGPSNAQATCTQLVGPMVNLITSSIANGSVCLPQAFAGREIMINNATGQTVNIFGSNSPFTVGTADTINGTAGSTAYTSLTNNKNSACFAPANGTWACNTGQ